MTNAREWLDLIRSFSYSSWENRVEPATGTEQIVRTPERRASASPSFQLPWHTACRDLAALPYAAAEHPGPRLDRIVSTSAGRIRVPNRLDSADFGNDVVYCAMGCWGVEDRPDLSRIIKLCGPDKMGIPISPPHYDLPGGPEYRRIDASKLLLFGRDGVLFRDAPRQRQRRVRDTAVWVTEIDSDGVAVTLLDFAPLAPALSLVCRLFILENRSGTRRPAAPLHQLFAASGAHLRFQARGGGLEMSDPADGTGVYVRSSAALEARPARLRAAYRDIPSETVDAQLPFPPLEPGEAAAHWSIIVPLLAAGHPEQDAALSALAGFDPRASLGSTLKEWRAWSSRVRLDCDQPVLEDLVNGLALLLKVHEGRHGLHLGTTYQRHTHCWVRDNHLMQCGLWAAGRHAEAEKDVRAFGEYWRLHGPAWGYHVAARRSWNPHTSPELCSHLVLMARELHRHTGTPPEGDLLAMVRSCADGIQTNPRGLAGFDGDEAWFWELDPRLFQVDGGSGFDAATARLSPSEFSVLDNCWLSMAALRYAADLVAASGDAAEAGRWQAKADGIARRVESLLWDPRSARYSALLFPDGRRYPAPLVCGHCTPWLWGIRERRPGSFAAGVAACEQELMTPEGILRGNRDTDVIAGMTPSFHLHALACIGDGARIDRALASLLASLPSSGACWEYASIDCPITGTDKRRGLDSGALLAALLRATVGLDVTGEGIAVRPRLPAGCTRLAFGDMAVRGRSLLVEVDASGARVDWAGTRYRVGAGSTLSWEARTDSVRVG